MKDRFTQDGPGVAYVALGGRMQANFCRFRVGAGWRWLALLLAAGMIMPGLADQPRRDDLRGVEAAERAVRSAERGEPRRGDGRSSGTPALLDGRAISWEEMQPGLAELAGAQVLQEVVLDRLLEAAVQQQGLRIEAESVMRERELLVSAIVQEARATTDDAERLLARVRRSRGLGDHRFSRLLERNAKLRALVQDEVVIEREEIDREFLLRYGPRFRARVIMTGSQREAAEIRERLAGEEEHLLLRFAEAAAMSSIDPSAERGGIVDPISPADPSYPASVRQAVERLSPGELSDVLAVDGGFAVLLLEERIGGTDVELQDVEGEIRDDLLRRSERMAMDSLARRMLREADLTVMDRGLDWSWRGGAR